MSTLKLSASPAALVARRTAISTSIAISTVSILCLDPCPPSRSGSELISNSPFSRSQLQRASPPRNMKFFSTIALLAIIAQCTQGHEMLRSATTKSADFAEVTGSGPDAVGSKKHKPHDGSWDGKKPRHPPRHPKGSFDGKWPGSFDGSFKGHGKNMPFPGKGKGRGKGKKNGSAETEQQTTQKEDASDSQ